MGHSLRPGSAAPSGGAPSHSINVRQSPLSASTTGFAPAKSASSTKTANNSAFCRPSRRLKIARERGLDLVEVSPTAVPPVCRIQDYGRFLYEKEKSERAARKKQKVITVKEVKFSVTVDEHDYQTKKNQAVRFLTEGDKVKASLRFRGRQMAHRELGYKIINRLIQDIGEAGMVEFMPRMEGTILHAIMAPRRKEPPKPKPAAAAPAPQA